MGQQVPDPHRLGGGHGHRLEVGPAGEHPDVGEGRDERADRVVQLEGALLVEHHRRDRGDRLGHRVDAPQGVGLDRQPGLDVARAVAGHVGQPAPPAHRDQPAGSRPSSTYRREMPVDPVQPRRVEAHLGRVRLSLELGHRPCLLGWARRVPATAPAPDPATWARDQSSPVSPLCPGTQPRGPQARSASGSGPGAYIPRDSAGGQNVTGAGAGYRSSLFPGAIPRFARCPGTVGHAASPGRAAGRRAPIRSGPRCVPTRSPPDAACPAGERFVC